MCRAQGIAHQKVTEAADLQSALQSAWALKRHSVVEVITGRDSNVQQHRQLQASVQQAVHQAAGLLLPVASGTASLYLLCLLCILWEIPLSSVFARLTAATT